MDENEDDELNTTTSGSETDEAVESDVDMEDDIWNFHQTDTSSSIGSCRNTVKPRFTGSLSNVFLDIQYILRNPCISPLFLC